MLGKIFFNSEWKLCRFEMNKLEILRTSCEAPLRLQNKKFNPSAFTVAEFEDGYFYFFNLGDDLTEVNNEYVEFELKVQSYFKSLDVYSIGEFDLAGFEKIIFKNGVLMPMITLSDISKFNIEIDELSVQIEFCLNEVVDDFLCTTKSGTMLSNYPIKKIEYELVASLPHAVDFSVLNKIAKKVYKIIQFINADFNAPIESIIVKTNIGDLEYSHIDICLTNKPVIKRYNYINNCRENIKAIAQNLVMDTCDVGFLTLIDKDNLIDIDYWLLGQSLETNIPDKIGKKLQNLEMKTEINVYDELKKKINDTIEEFELNHSTLDEDRKSFILSSTEIAQFRKKAEFVFERYNNFAKQYRKYNQFDDTTLRVYSKILQTARNTVHNSRRKQDNQEEAEAIATICIVGLYIYILEKSGVSSDRIFNLIQCFYS